MSDTYNLYNLEAPFKEYLSTGNHKPVSIKNYMSDFRHFAGWITLYLKSNSISKGEHGGSPLQEFITVNIISEYKFYLSENNIPHKTVNRRLSTVRKFCSFCISQGWMKENPGKKVGNVRAVGVVGGLLKEFKEDLLKENLDSKTVNSYLSDIREFLGLL
jgi:site-specific recombinase XerD